MYVWMYIIMHFDTIHVLKKSLSQFSAQVSFPDQKLSVVFVIVVVIVINFTFS